MFVVALFMVCVLFGVESYANPSNERIIEDDFQRLMNAIAHNETETFAKFIKAIKKSAQRSEENFNSTKDEVRRIQENRASRQHLSVDGRQHAATFKRDSGVQPVEQAQNVPVIRPKVENVQVIQQCLKLNGLPMNTALKDLEKSDLLQIVTCLLKEHENVQKEVCKFKGFTWKIVPRIFFDDIESLYKPRYDKYNDDRRNEEQKPKLDHVTRKMTDKPKYVPLHTTPADYPDGRDPRAVRMRQKYDFWDWLTTQHADDDTVKKILEKKEKKFRSMEKPPIPEERELTEEEKGKLEKFRKKTCKATGFASESASFILHGHQAVELFEGELEDLNIYGDEVDPYLVPVLNAVAPLTKEGVEPATFMKTE